MNSAHHILSRRAMLSVAAHEPQNAPLASITSLSIYLAHDAADVTEASNPWLGYHPTFWLGLRERSHVSVELDVPRTVLILDCDIKHVMRLTASCNSSPFLTKTAGVSDLSWTPGHTLVDQTFSHLLTRDALTCLLVR